MYFYCFLKTCQLCIYSLDVVVVVFVIRVVPRNNLFAQQNKKNPKNGWGLHGGMVCGPPFLSTEQIELERAREYVPSARLEVFLMILICLLSSKVLGFLNPFYERERIRALLIFLGGVVAESFFYPGYFFLCAGRGMT